jgi:serine/threonine-protein kinase
MSQTNEPINNQISHLKSEIILDGAKLVAVGGMAEIYRAFQSSLDRPIAVKKLKLELALNPDTRERFRREAKSLASVLHQNIIHVYDFVDGEEPYILMEYIEGVDLSTVVERVGHLPAEIAACILLEICRGVSYIHTHKLVHRDIKPSNIRLTNRGEVKLMDFGIAMDLDSGSLTKPGLLVGSPSYLSPEQVLGDTVTPLTDIFLLGITFYEMLTGTRPFKEEGGKTVFQKIREVDFVSAKKMQPSIPSVLNQIIKRCLKQRPKERYHSVKDIIYDLESFLGSTSLKTQDLLLKYLDEEVLLKPAMKYEGVDSDDRKGAAHLREAVAKVCRTYAIPLIAALILISYYLGTLQLFSF